MTIEGKQPKAVGSLAAGTPSVSPDRYPDATPVAAQDGLEFATDDAHTGFRLHRLELLNWGTFHERVWALDLRGENALLTGEIGSGKSTIIDAVTTLLVAPRRVAYNRAAGAESGERNLRSYVLGHFKTERSDATGGARPTGLRDTNGYTVILGEFRNEGNGQTVALAHVLWIEDQNAPKRFYVAAERSLEIAVDFAEFGADLSELKARLKRQGAHVFDTFTEYGAHFRRRFGIADEQAMELFHQAVSMKSVGSLTGFVRTHMLEPFDAGPRIEALLGHFDDLTRAHGLVLAAKRQADRLTPLVGDADRHDDVVTRVAEARASREALETYFAGVKAKLLDERISDLTEQAARRTAQVEQLDREKGSAQHEVDELVRSIAANGGDRIAQLETRIQQSIHERDRSRERAESYEKRVAALGLAPARDHAAFATQQVELARLRAGVDEAMPAVHERRTHLAVELAGETRELSRVDAEIAGLRGRRTNIPQRHIDMRRELCAALGLHEDDLPFAGELIQVRGEDSAWEGAAERLLRTFALSILAPHERYRDVVDHVDRTHLSERLGYVLVRPGPMPSGSPVRPESLLHKLMVHEDAPASAWLEAELRKRFDVVCCSDPERFRREPAAITRAGQVKLPDGFHEKDDRHAIDDRSAYVLGWSNEEKIAALESVADGHRLRIAALVRQQEAAAAEYGDLRQRSITLEHLGEYRDFHALDWRRHARDVEHAKEEKRRLEEASNVLFELTSRLEAVRTRQVGLEKQLVSARDERSKLEQRLDDARAQRELAAETLRHPDAPVHSLQHGEIEALLAESLGDRKLTIESCDARQREVRETLQARIDALEKQVKVLEQRIVAAMEGFRKDFPGPSQEIDARVEAAPAYRKLLQQLLSDDLPRFEEKFKELLNQNTIKEVANFQAQLNRERETIRDRIDTINASLRGIDYNPGRYIQLRAEQNHDADIRDFRAELRACTEGAVLVSDDPQEAERRFLQVKRILERFRGREGTSDLDKRWTDKVTDVRSWFTFAASERWREGGDEHEHYTDSGGKSGGQKEKLAYTILAASLSYRFGLKADRVSTRSFRFVAIDEAFGRGSDESARYGMELFKGLGLQLLVATPMQKIHVIEPYVANVGFVQSRDGRESMLQNVSIEEFRAEREQRRKREAALARGDAVEPSPPPS